MLQTGSKSVKIIAISAFLCLVGGGVLYYITINESNNGATINVSPEGALLETTSSSKANTTPSRKANISTPDSVKNEEKTKKNEQKFHGLKKYTTFNTANTKPFFKVGPGSVKKLSTEKPEQSNPFITGVEPSSSDRLPTITVDDESVPAIFFSSQNLNDCESQSPIDTFPEIDLLTGKLMISPSPTADSSQMKKP